MLPRITLEAGFIERIINFGVAIGVGLPPPHSSMGERRGLGFRV
jgi:hypothetical protein